MNSAATAVCNYALLRYLPYPDTGEFVNVGVVVACAAPALLEFSMEPEDILERTYAFFPEIDRSNLEAAHAAMKRELERVRAMVNDTGDPKAVLRSFKELVRPRESSFRFGEIRTTSTQYPGALAGQLFDFYVLRLVHIPIGAGNGSMAGG